MWCICSDREVKPNVGTHVYSLWGIDVQTPVKSYSDLEYNNCTRGLIYCEKVS